MDASTASLLDVPAHLRPRTAVRRYIDRVASADGAVYVVGREHLDSIAAWADAFGGLRKDRRFYEIIQDTLPHDFAYQYFGFEDAQGRVRAIQPFFVLRQDLLQGAGPRVRRVAEVVRRWFPRFLTLRTLMVGCAAGEGHLDKRSDDDAAWVARRLHEVLKTYARRARVPMVVLKEFPAAYREALAPFANNGYARVPSLPSVRVNIDYADFEQYLSKAISKVTRKDLRRKFRDADAAGVTMEVVRDIEAVIDEVYPLYLQVYDRSELHFEKLTKQCLCRLGREMPDKVRFFLWRQNGRAVAFSFCMAQGDELHDEYVGLDYAVALDLHLYFSTLRDVMNWAMHNGFKWYCSSAQGYEPKLRLKAELVPLDLYVGHTNGMVNGVLKRVLPWLEPTRGDQVLRKYPNYAELWGGAA